MAAIHETAYPRLKPSLSPRELLEIFAPTDEEFMLLDSKTKKTLPISRLGFMVTLKCYQYLGRPVSIKKIPEPIKKYLENKLGFTRSIDLSQYDKKTRKRHLKTIRTYLKINFDQTARRLTLKTAALAAAATKENLADIINSILEELIKARFELPAYQNLVRLARAARTVTNNHYYDSIVNALSEYQKKIIDQIIGLVPPDDSLGFILSWSELKQEPKKPSPYHMKEFVAYTKKLRVLRQKIQCDLDFISPGRLEQLKDEAQIADIDDLKEMRSVKRYAIVSIFLYMKTAAAIDDLVQILINWIRKIETQAKCDLQNYRLKQGDQTDQLVLLLHNTLLAFKHHTVAQDKVYAIEAELGGKIDDIIECCKEHLGLTGDNHIAWTLKPYKNKRYVLFQILENLTVCSTSQDQSLETALKFIMQYRHSHKQWIDIDPNSGLPQPDLSLLSDGWLKAVTGVINGETVKKINRHYYEVAVLSVLAGDLNCSDAYVMGGYIFDDPNKQFITWEQFAVEVDSYCEIVKLQKEPGKFVSLLQARLRQTASRVDEAYPDNPHLVIDKGLPVLKKLSAKKEHPDFEKVKQLVMNEMPVTNIVDVIIDVENWLNLSTHFKPLSGYESKIADYPPRFVATTLAYGCNIGPTQAERSLQKFTRKQIAWLFNHHVTDKKLIKALQVVINRFHFFSLPRHWGSGDSVSVDGTFWDMYKQNLLAAHHIRYGRYGGIGYYHVSDQYIALFSNFISCGVHESVYLLDGLVENDTDFQPNKVHGDSWAQSEVLFGVAPLLAVEVMPRIKHFKHLYYYKASSQDHYENIDELFTEKALDWDLIETHYHDMLRVVISI